MWTIPTLTLLSESAHTSYNYVNVAPTQIFCNKLPLIIIMLIMLSLQVFLINCCITHRIEEYCIEDSSSHCTAHQFTYASLECSVRVGMGIELTGLARNYL